MDRGQGTNVGFLGFGIAIVRVVFLQGFRLQDCRMTKEMASARKLYISCLPPTATHTNEISAVTIALYV